MTTHGTGRSSIENALARAQRREAKLSRIIHWARNKRTPIVDQEAYDKKAAEYREINERHGLPNKPKRRTVLETQMHFMAWRKTQKKATMPTYSFNEKEEVLSEREAAELRAHDTIVAAVQSLSFAIAELSAAPWPKGDFESRVYQKYLIETVRRLCMCTKPYIESPTFGPGVTKETMRIPASRVCVNCGGPGRNIFAGEWYCGECE